MSTSIHLDLHKLSDADHYPEFESFKNGQRRGDIMVDENQKRGTMGFNHNEYC